MTNGIALHPDATLSIPHGNPLDHREIWDGWILMNREDSSAFFHDKLFRDENSQEVHYEDHGFWKTSINYDNPLRTVLKKVLNALSYEDKNRVFGKVFELSPNRDGRDLRWGEHHALDNIALLLLALIDLKFLDKDQVIGRDIEGYRRHLETAPYESRDALLTAEMESRQLENPKYKKQMNYSVANRSDLNYEITLDPMLREALGIDDEKILQGRVILMKNSPMNGKVFKNEEGEYGAITDAVASSNDKTAPHVLNGRVANAHDGASICYSGKVDSHDKAKNQARFMFLNELHGNQKGFRTSQDSEGRTVIEQTYLVQSLLSPSSLTQFDEFDEKKSTLDQEQALRELSREPIEIEDPMTGRKYRVKFKPLFFVQPFNGFSIFEKILPDYMTGKAGADRISDLGLAGLKAFAMENETAMQLIEKLENEGHDMLPEEAVLCRIYLAQLLDLPINLHCKSSVDRTSMGVALAQALDQWVRAGNTLPKKEGLFDPSSLLNNPLFQELVAANIMIGHQLTSIARSGEGVVNGKPVKNKNLGFSWTRKLLPMPVPPRLLPSRYSLNSSYYDNFKKYVIEPLNRKVPDALKPFLIALAPVILILSLIFGFIFFEGIGLAAPIYTGSAASFKPLLGFTALAKLPLLFSTPQFNESSTQVGPRHLVGPPGDIAQNSINYSNYS